MKKLFLLICCLSVTIILSSCTAESLENETPAVSVENVTQPVTPVEPTPTPPPPPPVDHGGGDKDKDGDN